MSLYILRTQTHDLLIVSLFIISQPHDLVIVLPFIISQPRDLVNVTLYIVRTQHRDLFTKFKFCNKEFLCDNFHIS